MRIFAWLTEEGVPGASPCSFAVFAISVNNFPVFLMCFAIFAVFAGFWWARLAVFAGFG